MTDYTKVCWYCGSTNMLHNETWYQCGDCGATHVPSTARTFSPVTEIDAETGGPPRPGRPTIFRPSGYAVRKATRAREDKSKEVSEPPST